MMFRDPAEHAANPPESWVVVKRAERCWSLTTRGGVVLETYRTRRDAEYGRTESFPVRMYEQERRWFAGEPVPMWRPWADVLADRERRMVRP